MLAGTAGVQAGVVLAFLSSRVLGQYDPFGGDNGRLLLVAPNVVGAQRALDVPAADFRLWVCLHECTHRLQFTAVPWLRSYFADEVAKLLSSIDGSVTDPVSRLSEVVRSARQRLRASDARPVTGLIELLQSPEQRRQLDRLIALSTLLEGHADHVMDAVGPQVVPSVAIIRERFAERRKGGGLLDRVLRTLLGVEAKVRQYAEGAAFTREVIDAVGMDGFNAVWSSPETLPTRPEIAEPSRWLRRVTANGVDRRLPAAGPAAPSGACSTPRSTRVCSRPARSRSVFPAVPIRWRWPLPPPMSRNALTCACTA